MNAFSTLRRSAQHDLARSASPGSSSTGTSTTLSMHCTGCTSAVFVGTGSSFSGVSASPQSKRNSGSRSCQCRASVGDSLLRILNLVLVAAVGNVDQIVFLGSGDVSGLRLSWLPTSRTMEREFNRCGSALLTPAVGPLFSHPLWVRSSLFFFTLVLVKAAGTSRCSSLSVAPCTTLSWRSMSYFVANC